MHVIVITVKINVFTGYFCFKMQNCSQVSFIFHQDILFMPLNVYVNE